jgi:hypothetical protein
MSGSADSIVRSRPLTVMTNFATSRDLPLWFKRNGVARVSAPED